MLRHGKWSVLISASFMQLVLGIIYIWGVFQPEVVKFYGWSVSSASMVFSVMVAFIVVGSIVGGKLQDTLGPRPVVLVSGAVIAIGSFAASYTPASSPLFMYATYGMLSGFGIGSIYTTTIAAVQKWFKKDKALGTGIVLCALGLGGVVFTPVIEWLLNNVGVPQTFVVLSLIYFVVCILGGLFIVDPKVEKGEAVIEYTGYSNGQMLKSKMYYVLVATMTLSLPAYFMISPLIKIMSLDRGVAAYMTTYVLMAFSILNSLGRFIGPAIGRRCGDKTTIIILNVITILSSVGMVFVQSGWFVIFACLIAVSFGGFLGIFPGITSETFGIKYAASNYGLVLIGYGVSAIFAPGIYEIALKWGDYAPFVAVSVLSIFAIVVSRFIHSKTS